MGGSGGHREAWRSTCERADIADRLRFRRPEMEEAIGARALAVAGLTGSEDSGYREGLRAAIAAAVGFALEAIESGIGRGGPVPVAALVQARLAARSGVGLTVVLRRYAAGYSVLGDRLAEELGYFPSAGRLHSVLQGELMVVFDRLIVEVSAEYQREADLLRESPISRQADRVRRLLQGERVSSAELGYELGGWHLAAAASGDRAAPLLRELVEGLDRPSLVVELSQREAWAWLGGQRPPDPALLLARAGADRHAGPLIAIGEPGRGVSGWRASHRQAAAALSVAGHDPRAATRYADVAIVSAVLGDVDLTRFLVETYLEPLADGRGGGEVLRETLWAFLAAGQNASSAAAALGIARQTVTSRIRAIEERLARRVDAFAAEIEIALRLGRCLDAELDEKGAEQGRRSQFPDGQVTAR
jgi:hypothetical protein